MTRPAGVSQAEPVACGDPSVPAPWLRDLAEHGDLFATAFTLPG
ncbi:hypothetical protein [Nonomuraea longispora]|nr:hypothetical protein [Nonomuraea longispora]